MNRNPPFEMPMSMTANAVHALDKIIARETPAEQLASVRIMLLESHGDSVAPSRQKGSFNQKLSKPKKGRTSLSLTVPKNPTKLPI
jgi:hypothetical protein